MAKRRPWADYPMDGRQPTPATLQRWRRQAERLAKQRGAEGACHICKRPVEYRRGSVKLFPAVAWRSVPYQLFLCKECVSTVREFLDRLQVVLRRDEMEIDTHDKETVSEVG